MAYEIEMKAWVDDWEAVEAYLRRACTFEREFRKEDRYFLPPQAVDGEGSGDEAGESPGVNRRPEPRYFRIRIDGTKAYVTFKEKETRHGMERNLEREFTVDDAAAFVHLMERVGCYEAFAKVKEGLHFADGGLTVELVHVEELGDFLEVEFVHADDDDELHERAAAQIRRFFADAGIPDDRVEAEPYMKLLREARGGV